MEYDETDGNSFQFMSSSGVGPSQVTDFMSQSGKQGAYLGLKPPFWRLNDPDAELHG
jgi:hypothetical protein